MKLLDQSPISNTSQMPIKKGTLNFLQRAHRETVISLFKAMVGSTYNAGTPYLLYGLVDSGSGLVHDISEGAIVYLEEIFLVPAASFTSAVGEVPVLNLSITQFTIDADPVTFTDYVVRNVHNIREYAITSGTSGSGAFDLSALTRPVFDVATEQARAEGIESVLAASLIDIRSAWTQDNNNAYVTVYGGSGTNVTNCFLRYKQIGKTMFISFSFICSNTTAPTGFAILLPNSAQYAGNQYVSVPCCLSDSTTPKHARASLNQIADRAHIQITFPSGTITNTNLTEVTGELTFDTL